MKLLRMRTITWGSLPIWAASSFGCSSDVTLTNMEPVVADIQAAEPTTSVIPIVDGSSPEPTTSSTQYPTPDSPTPEVIRAPTPFAAASPDPSASSETPIIADEITVTPVVELETSTPNPESPEPTATANPESTAPTEIPSPSPGGLELTETALPSGLESTEIPSPDHSELDQDGDGYSTEQGDCDDTNADLSPAALEVANDGVDQDCDGFDFIDQDADGYDGSEVGDDCNDSDSMSHPDSVEYCDGIDNDCDGSVDDGVIKMYFPDDDGDGFGRTEDVLETCNVPRDYVEQGQDCNDQMWSVNPAGYEVCDGIDDDCDGLVDSDDEFIIFGGTLDSINEMCESFDMWLAVEVTKLNLTYEIGNVSESIDFPETLLVGGHSIGAESPDSWPISCTYFDQINYWYDVGDGAATYPVDGCFSKGTDATGGDEVYLSASYKDLEISGVFNNEEDADSEKFDEVDYSEAESDADQETWYVNDTADASATYYSIAVEIYKARAILTLRR